jgi:GntR family transcriptional regulator / MocR family aminotransferase
MRNSWATSGLDLHLDRTGPRVRAGLENTLRDAVRTGRLAPGLLLPSSRVLAADLGIARNTVADAYGQLVAEGWLTAERGSGTRVADRAPAVRAATAAPVQPASRPRYDLRPGSPDTSAFPRQAWLAAARRALIAAPAEALGYTDPRGRLELRQALAGYLARARGVQVTPDRIIVCSGFTQGLGLLCQTLRRRGATTLAVEACGLAAHRDVAAASGLAITTLPVDGHGAVVSQLGNAAASGLAITTLPVDGHGAVASQPGNAGAVLLTPAHQFPLGAALAPQRRSHVIDWAAASHGLVIEDDYDGEFRYDRQPVGALQALAPEHVVYGGTASKSLAPGLRLGWLVVPAELLDDLTAVKALTDRSTSSIEQLTLAEFISSGGYDRQVRRSRLAYRQRRDRLVAALRQHTPAAEISGITAGLHLLLKLPAGQTEEDIIARAAARGLALEGLGPYNATPDPHPPSLVIGYGTPPEHAFTGAIARLTAVLAADR